MSMGGAAAKRDIGGDIRVDSETATPPSQGSKSPQAPATPLGGPAMLSAA